MPNGSRSETRTSPAPDGSSCLPHASTELSSSRQGSVRAPLASTRGRQKRDVHDCERLSIRRGSGSAEGAGSCSDRVPAGHRRRPAVDVTALSESECVNPRRRHRRTAPPPGRSPCVGLYFTWASHPQPNCLRRCDPWWRPPWRSTMTLYASPAYARWPAALPGNSTPLAAAHQLRQARRLDACLAQTEAAAVVETPRVGLPTARVDGEAVRLAH